MWQPEPRGGLNYLWEVDTGPEALQVLQHLLWLCPAVENGQLCEHAHVGLLQAQGCLHQGHQLPEVAPILTDQKPHSGSGQTHRDTASLQENPLPRTEGMQ